MAEYIVKETGYPGRLETENVGELIRCKDCKDFRRWVNTDITFCDRTEYEVIENDFCSKAERKEGEAE